MSMTDIDGQTWDEWAAELFEYEYCDECGGDIEEHEPWGVMGHWFAHCRFTPGIARMRRVVREMLA